MALLHGLVPDVDPMKELIGAYLESQYGWLSRSTFLALGCALTAVALAVRAHRAGGVLPRVAAILLLLGVLGLVGVASAPAGVRYFAIPAQPATVLSILMLSIVLRRDPRWRPIGNVLVLIGGALVAVFLLTVVLGTLVALGVGGLANRLVLILIYVWVALVARGLLMRTRC